jgi:hypothetical protein
MGVIKKNKSSSRIEFKITKDPAYDLRYRTYTTEMSYRRNYLNNVKLVEDKPHGFDRDDFIDNSDDEQENYYGNDDNDE